MSRTVRAVALARAVLSALFPSRLSRQEWRAAGDLIRKEVWPAGTEHLRPAR
jgi:hypothetical protein